MSCIWSVDQRGNLSSCHGSETQLRPWGAIAAWKVCPHCAKPIKVRRRNR